MPDDTTATEQSIKWLWENRDWVLRKCKELYRWFRANKTEPNKAGILLLGAGGVGKTTLARILSGEFDLLFDALGHYDESVGVERFALKDAPNVELVVPPGQKHRREYSWSDIHADVGAGKYRGIILVSAFGFHSMGEPSYKNHSLFKGRKDAFLRNLLKSNRQDEIEILRQLEPHLRVVSRKLWLASVVVKQDLWWPQEAAVEEHYRKGDYGRALGRILNNSKGLRHEFLFASLLISNFTTKRDELLWPNSEGYDYRLQMESLRRLFETLDVLKNWESEK